MTETEQQELREIVNRANHIEDSQGVSRIDPLPQDLTRYFILVNALHLSFSTGRSFT